MPDGVPGAVGAFLGAFAGVFAAYAVRALLVAKAIKAQSQRLRAMMAGNRAGVVGVPRESPELVPDGVAAASGVAPRSARAGADRAPEDMTPKERPPR